MIAQVDVPDEATLDILYSKGFLTSDTNTVINSKQNPNKIQSTSKSKDRRNGNYSASPHSEISHDSRKQKRFI